MKNSKLIVPFSLMLGLVIPIVEPGQANVLGYDDSDKICSEASKDVTVCYWGRRIEYNGEFYSEFKSVETKGTVNYQFSSNTGVYHRI
ncbi:MAG: hypothetical protein ACRCXZ_00885 [Patescibacteria group bacterium]